MDATGQTKLPPDHEVINVQFDTEKLYQSLMYGCGVMITMSVPVIGCFLAPCCLPCFSSFEKRLAHSQKCQITDKEIIYESAWSGESHITVPINKVQNLKVEDDCFSRKFGIKNIDIFTTEPRVTEDGDPLPAARLRAPMDVTMIRDVILHRRDNLVRDMGGKLAMGTVNLAESKATLTQIGVDGAQGESTRPSEGVPVLK